LIFHFFYLGDTNSVEALIGEKTQCEDGDDNDEEKEEDEEDNNDVVLNSRLLASMAHEQSVYHEQMVNFNQQQLKNQNSLFSSFKSFLTASAENFKVLKDSSNETLNLMQESNIRNASLANQTLKVLQSINMQNESNEKFRSFKNKSSPQCSDNLDDLAVTNAITTSSSPSSSVSSTSPKSPSKRKISEDDLKSQNLDDSKKQKTTSPSNNGSSKSSNSAAASKSSNSASSSKSSNSAASSKSSNSVASSKSSNSTESNKVETEAQKKTRLYAAFKEKHDDLILALIPADFQDLDFRTMRSEFYKKNHNLHKVLDRIEGRYFYI